MKTIKEVKTYADFVEFCNTSMVLCNEIVNKDSNLFDNLENGTIEDDIEIFQWYIIDNETASQLKYFTYEKVFYSPLLDVYIWGIDHRGTAWDYVSIPLKNTKI
jgi:hypothetical protein